MPIFGKKITKPTEDALKPTAPMVEPTDNGGDDDEIVAAIIAAISGISGVAASKLVVRNLVRIPDRTTNWNRPVIESFQ